jgi:hypothetical protein
VTYLTKSGNGFQLNFLHEIEQILKKDSRFVFPEGNTRFSVVIWYRTDIENFQKFITSNHGNFIKICYKV